METITLTEKQAEEIGRAIFADIFSYNRNNYDRYFPWVLDDIRKEKGQPPLKPSIEIMVTHPCGEEDRPDDCNGFCPCCDHAEGCPARGVVTIRETDQEGVVTDTPDPY